MRLILSILVLMLIIPSTLLADRIERMISPAFHPTNFEDPRSISEARFIFMHHEIEDKFVTGGGDVQLYALQLRYAINDRFSIIATKDGYIDLNPNEVLPEKSGWADLAAGVKYVYHQDSDAGSVASFQLRYTAPTGNRRVLQGYGDGIIHPSTSAAFALDESFTLTTGTGLRIPIDSADSFFWDLDTQLDYRIDSSIGAWYPLVGASLIHIVTDGKRLPIADEGQDLFNFGASDAGGRNIVVGAAGVKYRPVDSVDIGGTFQFPLSRHTGSRILDTRWMFDVSYRF